MQLKAVVVCEFDVKILMLTLSLELVRRLQQGCHNGMELPVDALSILYHQNE